jgi:hypothetical protein
MKRVTLELGGKSPNILLDDADLSKAILTTLAIAFMNSGQACVVLNPGANRSLCALRRSPRCDGSDVPLHCRYPLRGVHERQRPDALAGAALARGAPVFAELNKYDATTHFLRQSTIFTLTGGRGTGETYCLAHHKQMSKGRLVHGLPLMRVRSQGRPQLA